MATVHGGIAVRAELVVDSRDLPDVIERKLHETIAVVGRGEFPVDMLRYDSCFPEQGSLGEYDDSEYRVVEVTTMKRIGFWTADRWSSFGWEIVTDLLVDRPAWAPQS
jgi:hypothetical protein